MAKQRGLRLFGHPVHPMVAGFPLALWLASPLWDAVGFLRGESLWFELAFWTLALGSAAALPAMISGIWELAALPAEHPATDLAWWHMTSMLSASGCFVASLLLRRSDLGVASPSWTAIAWSVAGLLLAFGGGWLGGEMVFRHGVAVDTVAGSLKSEKDQEGQQGPRGEGARTVKTESPK